MFKKKWLSVFAISLLLICVLICADAEEQPSQAVTYNQAVQSLSQCLTERKLDPEKIMAVAESFQTLGNYEYSATFYYYTKALADIEKGDYTQLAGYMQLISWNEPFQDELKKMAGYGVQVAAADEWAAYLTARAAEAAGDHDAAINGYRECLNFCDATDRALSLALNARQDAAQKQAATAAPAQETQGTTIPTLNVSPNQQGISLSWTSVPGATQYTIYSRRTSYDSDFTRIGSTAETSYGDTNCRNGFKYTYYVQASDGKGNIVKSNEAVAVANGGTAAKKTTASSEKKKDNDSPTPKPTTKTSSSTAEDKTWSAWSDWSTAAVSSSATRQVETKTESETTYKKQYSYSRYRYLGKNGNWWYYPREYSGSNYLRSGSWQYKTTDTPLDKAGTAAGQTSYSGWWYNESVSNVATGTKDVTYYRYRDKK